MKEEQPMGRLNAHDETFSKLFTEPLTVPLHQRPYSWKSSHILAFINDVVQSNALNSNSSTDPSYYMGTLILAGDKEKGEPLTIIDGQQRLTSMVLCLIALRSIYEKLREDITNNPELEDDENISVIDTQIIQIKNLLGHIRLGKNKGLKLKHDDNEENLRLNAIFNGSLTDPILNSQPNWLECYEAATNRLQELIDTEESVGGQINKAAHIFEMFQAVTFATVSTEDKRSGHKIFEALNDRGLPLTSLDLIKNRLLAELDEGDSGSVRQKWSDILYFLVDSSSSNSSSSGKIVSDSDFVTYVGTSFSFLPPYAPWGQQDKTPEDVRVYRRISSWIDSAPNDQRKLFALALLDELWLLAFSLQFIHKQETGINVAFLDDDRFLPKGKFKSAQWEMIAFWISGITAIKRSQSLPPTISLIYKFFSHIRYEANPGVRNPAVFSSPAKLNKSTVIFGLKAVFFFQFLWRLSNRTSTSTQRKPLNELAKDIASANSSSSARNSINKFVESFSLTDGPTRKTLVFSHSTFAQELQSLQYSNRGIGDKFLIIWILLFLDFSTNAPQFIHQAAGRSIEHIAPVSNSAANARPGWKANIGNMLVIPRQLNGKLNDDSFEDKAPHLLDFIRPYDTHLLAAATSEVPEWNKEQAEKRSAQLAEMVWDEILKFKEAI